MTARVLFFAGKGGVGKTTCAAARAVAAARTSERVLVVSTDPAHSLGDALGVRLTARPHPVRCGGGGRLSAVELDAPRAFARWLADHRGALGDIVEHGTWLDREDVDALLGLSMPGIDELVGLIEIVRLANSADYALVIIDTAPTGHTLRLFGAPDTIATVAAVLDALQREHRIIREQFAHVGRPEAADRLITLLAAQAHEAAALLRDGRRSSVYWVLLPEELSLAESEDGIAALDRMRVRIAEVIVNRVTPDGPSCPICDRRREQERRVMAGLPGRLGSERPVRLVPAELREPRGVVRLARIGKRLASAHAAGVQAPGPRRANYKARAMMTMRFSAPASERRCPPESFDSFRGAQLLLFGGKGGVGKTTCAAATALRLARMRQGRPLLLLSTDPAHSLGDVFGVRIGDRVRLIPGAARNLHARELDAAAALAARRTTLEMALNEMVAAFGAHGVGTSRSGGVTELMDLAPPGIDELLAVLSVVEAQKEYDLIVVDTAPTGHALRLLEMPDAARDWVQALMRTLLKYRALVRPGQLASELVDLSKSIRRLHELLHNSRNARVIVVTRGAEVPRLETERLLGQLQRLKLAVPAVVLNAMTLAPGDCPRCRATASAERVQLTALRRVCRRRRRECAIILTPLAAPAPRGVAALDRWARSWSSWSHVPRVPTCTASLPGVERRR